MKFYFTLYTMYTHTYYIHIYTHIYVVYMYIYIVVYVGWFSLFRMAIGNAYLYLC